MPNSKTRKPSINSSPITVLGAGAWGTALAIVLARNGQPVRLWTRDAKHSQAMIKQRCNAKYLSGINFPDPLQVFDNLSDALKNVEDILLAVPSQAFLETLQLLPPYIHSKARLLWATKGLDPQSSRLLHEVVAEELGGQLPVAVLTGPSFAREVATGLPTAITIAANQKQFAQALVARFHSNTFRVYISDDLIGAQLGGAIKNILAIAAGISDGLGFGANARSALITRGLAEMMRLGAAMGAKKETLVGLAGLGDLVLTCTDNQSRNRRFGLALGSGMTIQEAEKSIGQTIEGIHNAKQAYQLSLRYAVEMPITEQVYQILFKNLPSKQAVNTLLLRDPKMEF